MSTTSAWHAASPQGRLCHVPIFQLPTLDPTHLRISHLEKANRPFASKRPLLAPPWRNHGSSQKKPPHTGPRARYAQSDFDRKSCTPALYASFVWYASLRLYKPRGMHSLMRTCLPTVLFVCDMVVRLQCRTLSPGFEDLMFRLGVRRYLTYLPK